MATEFDADQIIAQVSERLQERFPDEDVSRIRDIVGEEVSALTGRPVQDYVAVLSERAAKKRLKNP